MTELLDGNKCSYRVLLAEDHKVNQMLATTMLENLGHTVRIVVNGADALEAIKNEKFDLVFMDIQMPVMNGVEAASPFGNLMMNAEIFQLLQ